MTLENSCWLSVIIPLFNEEKRIEATFHKVVSYLNHKNFKWEIILVDDKSSDRTIQKVSLLVSGAANIRLIALAIHKGKGGAIREGVLNSIGENILFMDADSSTEIQGFEIFEPWINKGQDIVIGSRKVPNVRLLTRQPRIREFLGKCFTLLSNIIILADISDFTCGFKCFSKKSAMRIFTLQRLNDWSFDAEIIFLARKFNYSIVQIPVVWADVKGTKVKLARDILVSLFGLFKIRLNDLMGLYK